MRLTRQHVLTVGLAGLCISAVASLRCGGRNDGPGSSSPTSAGAGGGNTQCPDGWCTIPSGSFLMGSPETEFERGGASETQFGVTLTSDFLLSSFEVTQQQWVEVGFPNPSGQDEDNIGDCTEPACPVGSVSWWDALAFANARSTAEGLPGCYDLSSCTGSPGVDFECSAGVKLTSPNIYACTGYRLPTEAEWEYAARAGTATAFPMGDIWTQQNPPDGCEANEQLEAYAWYCANSGGVTHPVGTRAPNSWGLHDMAGNAAEWVHDHFTPSGYEEKGAVDPGGQLDSSRELGVFRGGPYLAAPGFLRSAGRTSVNRTSSDYGLGFRLARSL
ncbi:MAG: formylglycine-generating enzyme family protein [Planctomycetota bacterium]